MLCEMMLQSMLHDMQAAQILIADTQDANVLEWHWQTDASALGSNCKRPSINPRFVTCSCRDVGGRRSGRPV